MEPLQLIVYSDYLCPWCYVVSVRLRKLEEELDGALHLQWRSYLLRPHPPASGRRDLEKFRLYTKSWQRPASEPDAPSFRIWESDTPPPSHSMPPHLVAKAAASFGEAAFHRMHDRLLAAYFNENRDVSDPDTLLELWQQADLPADQFDRCGDPALVEQVVREHNEGVTLGIGGVPAVRAASSDAAITGAFPTEMYQRWIDRLRRGVVS